jgi:conjugative transfer region protein (TIGR03748 family)
MSTLESWATHCAPSRSRLLRHLLLSIALVAAAPAVVFLPEAVAQEKTPGMLAYEAANPLGAAHQDPTDLGADESRVARYSTITLAPSPTARAPLAVIATVNFPRGHVQTVGDAVQHLLLRTGYQLERDRLTRRAAAVLAMPLPDSHRRLGPYRVDQMLSVLLGEPWVLSVDAASRTVTYAASGDTSPLANQPAPASPNAPTGTAAAASASAPT